MQPGPSARRAACKPLACSVPVRGWVARGLHLGSAPAALICGNWATMHGKKSAEGALPAACLLAITWSACVCVMVFKGGVRLWKPACACPESMWELASRGTNASLPWPSCDVSANSPAGRTTSFSGLRSLCLQYLGKKWQLSFLETTCQMPGAVMKYRSTWCWT